MTGRILALVAALAASTVLFCVGGLPLLTGSASACTPTGTASTATAGYDAEQLVNAQTIIAVGEKAGVPVRGQIIALATALQESRLRNLGDLGNANDHDSRGLFQQRPSQGWGTPAQLTDPAYAAAAFYRHLIAIPGWQTMPLALAAQRVQLSALPDAYAQWEPAATTLAARLSPDSGCLHGQTVLQRAATWLTAWNGGPVPYLSSGNPATWLNGYRRDCSGYASMALGLPGPGRNGRGLAAGSTVIAKAELRAGDLLINPTPGAAGHVVIFDHWTDSTMTHYLGYEQSADGGTHHRDIPYPYFGNYPMSPSRFSN